MSSFSAAELEYLKGQRFARIATVDEEGQPHVVPVGFRYNAELDAIEVGGKDLGKSKKFRNVRQTSRAAIVIDDVPNPKLYRGVEVRGRADALSLGGPQKMGGFEADIIRIYADHVASWGIEEK
jgi:pyridoxamine 5'-phosphate oxidase family protein